MKVKGDGGEKRRKLEAIETWIQEIRMVVEQEMELEVAFENGFGVSWYQPTNWSPSASEKGQLVCLCACAVCACVLALVQCVLVCLCACAVCTIACTLLLHEAVQRSVLHWKGTALHWAIAGLEGWRHSH